MARKTIRTKSSKRKTKSKSKSTSTKPTICKKQIKFKTKPKKSKKYPTILPQEIPTISRSLKQQPNHSKSSKSTIQCWAHTLNGQRCKSYVPSTREGEMIPIPYCNLHLKAGDGALKVVHHPFAGKCLVARFPLPPKYRIVFHGIRGRCLDCTKEDRSISFYPPDKLTGRNKDANGNIIAKYNGVLNPKGTGDLIQYAACPGPGERQNMKSTFRYWGIRNGNLGGLEFITLESIPVNTQLLHWYGPGWWSARDLKRQDVGTKNYPAPRREKSK